jgi:hypothetical protein
MTIPPKLVVGISCFATGAALLLGACSAKNPQDLKGIDGGANVQAPEASNTEASPGEANATEAASPMDTTWADTMIDSTTLNDAPATFDLAVDDNSAVDTAAAIDGEP